MANKKEIIDPDTMASEEDITNPDTQALDHRFRSLTCLGELLYNENVHDPIPAQSLRHQTDRHALQEKGGLLVLQLSRVLVRQPRENVTFAVMMLNGGVEKTMATSNTPTALLNPTDDEPTVDDNSTLHEVIECSRAYTHSPSPGEGNPPSGGTLLPGHPSAHDLIDYIVIHFEPLKILQKKNNNNKPENITFDAHVRNTLGLLAGCSYTTTPEAMDADVAFLTYTACMGIEKWRWRYKVDPIVRSRYSCDDIPFHNFLQLEDPLRWVPERWPTSRIFGEEKKALLKFLEEFVKIFEIQYHYTKFFGDDGAASRHQAARREIAHVHLATAMKAVERGRVDANVARFYHVTLGQAFKDVCDWSNKVVAVLTSSPSPTDTVRHMLFKYVVAATHLNLGVSHSGVLLTQYKKALRTCLGRKAPSVPWDLWAMKEDEADASGEHGSSENARFDLYNKAEYEDNDVADDAETVDDEGSDNNDHYDDRSMTSKSPSEPKAWTVAYITWLRNTVKTHHAVEQLVAFAKSKSHRQIVRTIQSKIQIHLCSPPSRKMEDWKETIRRLFPRGTGPAPDATAEDFIAKLECLAKYPHAQNINPPNPIPRLSFNSLNPRWSTSFNGTRHGESQFATQYSKVITATCQPPKRAN